MADDMNTPAPSGSAIMDGLKAVKDREHNQRIEARNIAYALDHEFDKIKGANFTDDGITSGLMVANTIALSNASYAEKLADMPTIEVRAPSKASAAETNRAIKRSQIVNYYANVSNLASLLQQQSSRYFAYGFAAFKAVADFDLRSPVFIDVDPFSCYWERGRGKKITEFWEERIYNKDEIKQFFPDAAAHIDSDVSGRKELKVVFYQNKDWDMILVDVESATGNSTTRRTDRIVLSQEENPYKKVTYRVAENWFQGTSVRHGMFDGVINTILARNELSRMVLKQIHKNVNSPLVVPTDAGYMEWNTDFVIRSDKGMQSVGYAQTNDTSVQLAASENDVLAREVATGARFSETMQGESDASIITGAGVKALSQPQTTMVRKAAGVFASTISELGSLLLEIDEIEFGDETKDIRVSDANGVEELTYTPKKDIAGKYSVDVEYGMTSGFSAENSVVAVQQLVGSKFISRETGQRELPFQVAVETENRKIAQEQISDSVLIAIQQYAMAIPGMAQQGQDPMMVLTIMKSARDAIGKGEDPLDAIFEAMKPPAPTAEEQAAMAAQGAGAVPPGTDPAAGGDQLGLLPGQAPGAQGQAPGSKPTVRNILASMDSSGRARSSVSVQSRQAI